MERKEKKHTLSPKHPANTAGMDVTEKGPSRLYAPGKPHEVESGPSRLRAGGVQTAAMHKVAPRGLQLGGLADTTEAGPARIVRYHK